MDELGRQALAERCLAVEEYHRISVQCCNVERCQARSARARRNHVGMAIRAFARLSWNFYATGVSWYEAKSGVVREAVRADHYRPLYRRPPIA
jgi:hypothetical protein